MPTSPTSQNWWFGSSLPWGGITWGLNTDPTTTEWQYVAELRGDPVMGAYGYVAKQVNGAYQLTCRANASFDGASYRVRFPVGCTPGSQDPLTGRAGRPRGRSRPRGPPGVGGGLRGCS